MEYKIKGNAVFPIVEVFLRNNEEILLERGAMVYHNNEIELTGKMNSNGKKGMGGMLSAIGRSLTSGESFFISHARGLSDTAIIALAPATMGAVKILEVGTTQWRLNDGAFLACDSTVNYTMSRQKIDRAIFGGTGGLFVMETTGVGQILIGSYGDLLEIELDGQTPYVIDNEHVVAWEASLNYQIKVASGTFGFTTGEGLVNQFTGKGKVLIQTRNIQALANIIDPFITKTTSS